MVPLLRSVAISVALMLACAFPPGPVSAQSLACATGDSVVAFADVEDAKAACLGAADAKTFLKANGLKTDAPIEIHIVERLPDEGRYSAYGCYDKRSKKVLILSSSACGRAERGGLLFGLPLDRRLYRSLVAHEVAHAVANANFAMTQPPWVADEYISYVTQLATMPADLRDSILGRSREQGFATAAQLNPSILLASPEVFAVKAYRHYIRKENGAAFVRALIAGVIPLSRAH